MPMTRKVMPAKNIDLGDAVPKGMNDLGSESFDLVINLSAHPLTPKQVRAPIREWRIKDPMDGKEDAYRDASDQIERLVMGLILELRQLRTKRQQEFKAVGRR